MSRSGSPSTWWPRSSSTANPLFRLLTSALLKAPLKWKVVPNLENLAVNFEAVKRILCRTLCSGRRRCASSGKPFQNSINQSLAPRIHGRLLA